MRHKAVRFFSLGVSAGAAPFYSNSQPHVALFLSLLAGLQGRYSLPGPPTTYSHLELSVLP